MSLTAAITLTDDTPVTPVNRVFNPAVQADGVYRYDNRASGIIAGYDNLTSSMRLPTKAAKSTKVQYRLTTPILEVTSPSTSTGIQPAPTVAYSLIGELTFTLPERSSLQDRKNLLKMLRDLIDEQIVTDAVVDYNQTYF
jgi:hypothetical protein